MSPSAARRPARKADVCTSDVGLLPVPALLGSLLTGTRTALLAVLAVLFAAPGAVTLAATEPPFGGTTFISPDVITEADPTALRSVVYTGRGERVIWDYRVFDWVTVEAYLFEAQIGGRVVEFQVKPRVRERGGTTEQVDVYAPAIGRLPAVLLSRLGSVHVNAGRPEHPDALLPLRPRQVFGGNWFDQSITIHTGKGEEYISGGFLEEVLFHEAAHVSVDGLVEDTPEWRAAQDADGAFISTYARDFPDPRGRCGEHPPVLRGAAAAGELDAGGPGCNRGDDSESPCRLRRPRVRLEPIRGGGPRASCCRSTHARGAAVNNHPTEGVSMRT